MIKTSSQIQCKTKIEVTGQLNNVQSKQSKLYSFDISNMYPNILNDDTIYLMIKIGVTFQSFYELNNWKFEKIF